VSAGVSPSSDSPLCRGGPELDASPSARVGRQARLSPRSSESSTRVRRFDYSSHILGVRASAPYPHVSLHYNSPWYDSWPFSIPRTKSRCLWTASTPFSARRALSSEARSDPESDLFDDGMGPNHAVPLWELQLRLFRCFTNNSARPAEITAADPVGGPSGFAPGAGTGARSKGPARNGGVRNTTGKFEIVDKRIRNSSRSEYYARFFASLPWRIDSQIRLWTSFQV